MGCSFSCRSKSSSSVSNKSIVRVVHLNGYIEDFDHPVTICEVTGNSPKHFVCTHVQLLSACSKPLTPDTFLNPGEIYFLLPFSVFQSGVSPMDFAPVAKKLVNIAKKKRLNSKVEFSPKALNTFENASTSFRLNWRSPSGRSPVSSPGRLAAEKNVTEEPEIDQLAGLMQKSTKSRSWKPILATIRERSFNRRSESDLQE